MTSMETTDYYYYYYYLIDWSDCYLYCYQSVKEVFNQQSTSNYILLLSSGRNDYFEHISVRCISVHELLLESICLTCMPFQTLYLRYRSMNLERLCILDYEDNPLIWE